ncbi:hypothetical protein DM01DRAFT_351017 [Hesseltinella vesiculosa]|uniref:Aph-1 n=1 Tax=Hesseltinella vesiculosa TaxID=101127 RepID=A0A1X2GIJ5_9FUNG|nr:hypothetical protein DM01DRAFT_351017 [Hesseltinella vesiculosa]
MTLYTFFGCLLTAYGPILSIFFLFIAKNAQHVLLTVASIAIQELFRWLYFLLMQRAEPGLNMVTKYPRSPFNRIIFAFVAGYGYALTTSLVSYVPILVESLGPGILMVPSFPAASTFFDAAVTTSFFSLLHMAWMVIAFDGFAAKKWVGSLKIGWVLASHLGASYSTLLNTSTIPFGCIYAMVIQIVFLLISVAIIVASLAKKR